jgi:glycosyltransferase involved in cell wall biosynthesis
MENQIPISVVMPVYNAQATLRAAIDSILAQTLESFEFIILDDGSTDGSSELLQEYQSKDTRLRVYPCDHHGIVTALNKGLELAQGEFIARMDADDLSLPHRFEIQLAYLRQHPEVGVCGSWAQRFGGDGGVIRSLADPRDVRAELLFQSPIIHPSAMLRSELLRKHNLRYEAGDIHAEDHGLWLRCSNHASLTNIATVLLRYRVRPGTFSSLAHQNKDFWQERFRSKAAIYRNALKLLEVIPSPEELALHFTICHPMAARPPDFLSKAEDWLLKLAEANQKTQIFSTGAFNRALGRAWFHACYATSEQGWYTWRTFRRSSLQDYTSPSPRQTLRFMVKCLLRKNNPRIHLP